MLPLDLRAKNGLSKQIRKLFTVSIILLAIVSCETTENSSPEIGPSTTKSIPIPTNDLAEFIKLLDGVLSVQSAFSILEGDTLSDVDHFIASFTFSDALTSLTPNPSGTTDLVALLEEEPLRYAFFYTPYFGQFDINEIRWFVLFDPNDTTQTMMHRIENNVLISQQLDQNDDSPRALIFILDENPEDPEKFPWHKCYCTRGKKLYDSNGNYLHTTTNGECSARRRDENCGFCGNANFWGNCPGDTCPGC